MRGIVFAICACALAASATARAEDAQSFGNAAELQPYLQCVPYARERSGVQIYGDARTWWDQAAGRYKRGQRPQPGAVMTFRPTGSMVLGHVAAVAKVIDSRTVLLDHANWSPIGGRRGQIERGVKAIDVSPANDWSQVRVWYAPLQDLGTTVWPVAGFIYNQRDEGVPLGGPRILASANYAPVTRAALPARAIGPNPSKAFMRAFAGLGEAETAKVAPIRAARQSASRRMASAPAPTITDPIEAALARYGS